MVHGHPPMMLGADESQTPSNHTILADDHSAAKPQPRGGPLRHLLDVLMQSEMKMPNSGHTV
jgi:hypothetical protein